MNKAISREKYKNLRAQLTDEQIDALSLQIANKVLELPIWKAIYFHLFLPITTKKEVNTEYILHILQGKDKSIVVSKSNFKSGDLTHILLQENTSIRISSFGIPEPTSGIEMPVETIDIVFIPLLAFDKNGNRIGYGKGFYDRFLAQCNANCIFIGLSFFPPEEIIFFDDQDVPLHYCVTPEKIYAF